MNIVIDKQLIEGYADLLAGYQSALNQILDKLEKSEKQADVNQLLTTEQAGQMLSCSAETLLYYRTKGLVYYKKGREGVWYRKGDIIDWVSKGYVKRR